MMPRIVLAAALRAGPATVVLALGGHTIRSRVVMAVAEPHGIVRVAFASGDVVALSARTAVGVIDSPPSRTSKPARRSRT